MPLTENPTLVQIVDEMERLNNLIVDRGGARTITPNTSNQVLSKGNYKGDITIIGDGDLQPHNIKQGVNLFGVNGNVTVQSLGGKRWASGSASTSSTKNFDYVNGGGSYSRFYIEISSLSFAPSTIVVMSQYDTSSTDYVNFSTYRNGYGVCVTRTRNTAGSISTSSWYLKPFISSNYIQIPVYGAGNHTWVAYE